MQPQTFDKQELENIIASISSVKDSLGTDIPKINGIFYMYNINGSLAAFDSQN